MARNTEHGTPATFTDVCLVDTPGASNTVPVGACCVLVVRREALHPVQDARWIHVDAALGEQLGDICVGQPILELPPYGKGDAKQIGGQES
jgi:hypothetical protein